MSRLVTQLVADDPAIVLVGEQTLLLEEFREKLAHKSVKVVVVDPQNLERSGQILQEAYKVIWIYESAFDAEQKYLEYVTTFSKITTQIIVVLPLVQPVENASIDLLANWENVSQTQLQCVVDINYYLSNANFIFGLDIIGNTKDFTSFDLVLQHVSQGVVIDPGFDFQCVSVQDFVREACEVVFLPKKQTSTLIKGKGVTSTTFISLIKKLYDAYHNSNLEVVRDVVQTKKIVPFSVQEKITQTDTRTIATHLVKKLPAPKKEAFEPKQVLPSPTPILQEHSPRQEILQQEHSQQDIPQQYVSRQKTPQQEALQQAPPLSEVSQTAEVQQQTSVVDPENNLDLSEKNTEKSETHTEKSQKPEELDVNKEIQRIFTTKRADKKVERVEKIVKSTKKIKKKRKSKTALFYGGLVSIGMAVGMIILAITYAASGVILKRQLVGYLTTVAETQNLEVAPGSAVQKTTQFVATQTNIYGQVIELDSIARNSVLVELSTQFIELPAVLSQADEASKNLVLQILNGSIGETTQLTEMLTQKAQEAYEKLSLIQASLEQIDFGENSQHQTELLLALEDKIHEIRAGLEIHQQLQQVLPALVGSEQKRTYAVLFQNNQELRPTGGFIQAVALLNFDDGSLVSYKVYSVYDLDKQLPGQVVPPEEISEFLGETNWYLRDSNWDPDFPKTASQVAWFIEKTIGITPDGVIGMNVHTLEDLLAATGPLDLPEYNEVLTDKNIEERMEFHSEVVLVDSPESVDYSVKVLTKLLDSLVALKGESVPTLLSSLQTSLEHKQLQIASFDESEQSVLNSLGWTGGLIVPSCPARLSIVDCSIDVMAQVEANIGVNKANYYLERSISHDISVTKTGARHTRTVTFENTAKSNSWPKGTYKSYQRFFIDDDAQVESVSINGSQLVPEQIKEITSGEFKSIGVRVDVPIQQQVTVELVYSAPLTATDSFSYVFYNRKQSGLEADPFRLSITHSADIKPILVAPSAEITGNTIFFDADNLDDTALFGVQFK